MRFFLRMKEFNIEMVHNTDFENQTEDLQIIDERSFDEEIQNNSQISDMQDSFQSDLESELLALDWEEVDFNNNEQFEDEDSDFFEALELATSLIPAIASEIDVRRYQSFKEEENDENFDETENVLWKFEAKDFFNF